MSAELKPEETVKPKSYHAISKAERDERAKEIIAESKNHKAPVGHPIQAVLAGAGCAALFGYLGLSSSLHASLSKQIWSGFVVAGVFLSLLFASVSVLMAFSNVFATIKVITHRISNEEAERYAGKIFSTIFGLLFYGGTILGVAYVLDDMRVPWWGVVIIILLGVIVFEKKKREEER